MSLLSQLFGQLKSRVSGRRNYTALEVRDLIARGDFDAAHAAAQTLFSETPQVDLTRLCLYGEIAFRQRRDEDAETHFLAALKQAPGLPGAHYGLSLVKLERGELDEALRHAQFAATQANEARFSAQLGLCQLQAANHGAAVSALARATRLDAADWSSWNNLGVAHRAKGDLPSAKEAFERALEIDPEFVSARENLTQLELDMQTLKAVDATGSSGTTPANATSTLSDSAKLLSIRSMAAAGRGADALEAAEMHCIDHPDDSEAVVFLAELHTSRGDALSALDVMQAFLVRHGDDFVVRSAYALALVKERKHRQAQPLLKKLLNEKPNDEALLMALADVHHDRGELAAAGALVEKVFELNPTLHNKGRLASARSALCEYELVLQLTDEMLVEEPRTADSLLAMRVDAYTNLGLHDKALPLLDQAIEMNPRDANRRFLRSSIHLLNERYAQGWDDYSTRLLSSVKHLRTLALPDWKGEPLQGKRIVVMCEQGLGDQVMFASCLPDLLAQKPARVVVEAVDRVAPTLARSFPACEVIASKQDAEMVWLRELGDMDYFTSLGDLPHRFRRDSKDFPRHTGYLKANSNRTEHWLSELRQLGHRPSIGVSWRGGTETTRRVLRTLDVAQLAPLKEAVDANWICLQYGDVKADLKAATDVGIDLHYWPQAIKDLDEFAALISALDLVITVCNTTVHYAGALGKPVWVMAPRIPEWRYGLHFKSLPWYPSSVMYRQSSDKDWASVLDAVAQDLSDHFRLGPHLAETSSRTAIRS
jgi:tetratricopeptide (TPR) repeat protein